MTHPHYDPLDPRINADPYPAYAALRREAPVYQVPGMGFYAVSRHADVATVLKRHDLFSSSAMKAAVMAGDLDGEWDREGPPPETLIGSDPPVHARLRKIANRGFTPSRIARLEPRVREISEGLVDRIASRGGGAFDLVSEFSRPLPITVIMEMLGVPEEQHANFKRWSDAMLSAAFENPTGERREEVRGALETWASVGDRMIEERKQSPKDDLISDLLRAEGDEGCFTIEEFRSLIPTLLVAGNVTTTHLLGNAFVALLREPGQLEKVVADPTRIPNLVEEALRYDSPVHLLLRQTTQEVELAGTRIPEGAIVTPLFASANRDEDVFPDADRFDVDRDASSHLAFGMGVHFCLGAPLARLEARVAFEVLLSRLRDLRLLEDEVSWEPFFLFRGPERLRLGFDV